MKLLVTRANWIKLQEGVWVYGAFHHYPDCSCLTRSGKPDEVEGTVKDGGSHWNARVTVEKECLGYICGHCYHRRRRDLRLRERMMAAR